MHHEARKEEILVNPATGALADRLRTQTAVPRYSAADEVARIAGGFTA